MFWLYVSIAVLFFIASALYASAEYFFSVALKRSSTPPRDFADVLKARLTGTDREYLLRDIALGKRFLREYRHEDITVTSHDGLSLFGRLYSHEDAGTTVVFVHGHRSASEVDFPVQIRRYYSLGYSVLVVDQRASGKSEGRYYCFGVLERHDTEQWCKYVRERFGDGHRIILFGCSMGGATVLMASDLPYIQKNVSAIIADCPYSSPKEEFKYILKTRYCLPSFPLIPMADRLTRLRAKWSFDSCTSADSAARTQVPVLLIHGTADKYVPAAFSIDIYEAKNGECELLLVEDASHGYSVYRDPLRYFAKTDAFIRKYGK